MNEKYFILYRSNACVSNFTISSFWISFAYESSLLQYGFIKNRDKKNIIQKLLTNDDEKSVSLIKLTVFSVDQHNSHVMCNLHVVETREIGIWWNEHFHKIIFHFTKRWFFMELSPISKVQQKPYYQFIPPGVNLCVINNQLCFLSYQSQNGIAQSDKQILF